MSRRAMSWPLLLVVPFLAACGRVTPSAPEPTRSSPVGESGNVTARAWGPETPPFDIEVILRGAQGFGLVKFRQPNDDAKVVNLDTWVRDLKPETAYRLQRAVDPVPDGNCTSSAWLTLGEGPMPRDLVTDGSGTARAALWRDLSAVATGTKFDIHFRVIEAAGGAVALESGCYQFVVDL